MVSVHRVPSGWHNVTVYAAPSVPSLRAEKHLAKQTDVIIGLGGCSVKVGEDDFRQRYAELSDEGLFSINREELVELARQCYDQELAKRGLQAEREPGADSAVIQPPSIQDEFVPAATFLFPDEAEVARGLLRSSDILCYLENEHVLAKVWQWNVALGGLRLMVPASLLEEVHQVLSDIPSEEDLIGRDGMEPPVETSAGISFSLFPQGRRGGPARAMLAIAIILCAPAADSFWLFYVGT